MILKYCTSIIILLAFSACSSQKKVVSSSDWKGKSVQFGSGGGITGVSNIYTLLENGQLFLRTGIVNGKETSQPDISKQQAKAIFARLGKFNWPIEDISHPGNMYYTVVYKDPAKAHAITWGDGKYQPDAEIAQLYKDLNSLISPEKK